MDRVRDNESNAESLRDFFLETLTMTSCLLISQVRTVVGVKSSWRIHEKVHELFDEKYHEIFVDKQWKLCDGVFMSDSYQTVKGTFGKYGVEVMR